MLRRPANAKKIKQIHELTRLMDEAFEIPGTGFRVGLDSIVGLIPGIGDAAGLAVSGYIIYQSYQVGVRKRTIARMAANGLVDFVGGSVPLIGDIFDAFYKSHRRNADLLERELGRLEFGQV